MAEGTLVGKVGSVVKEDPMLKFSPKGTPYAKFSLQVKPYTPKGAPAAEAVYYEVTAFGSLAENVAETIHKGQRVVVVGEGKVEEWTGNDGEVRTTKVIIAEGVGQDLRFVTTTATAITGAPDAPDGTEAF